MRNIFNSFRFLSFLFLLINPITILFAMENGEYIPSELEKLKNEIFGIICSHLDEKSILSLKCTSHYFDEKLKNEIVCQESRKGNKNAKQILSFNQFLRSQACGLHTSTFTLTFYEIIDLKAFLRSKKAQNITTQLFFQLHFPVNRISLQFWQRYLSKFHHLRDVDFSSLQHENKLNDSSFPNFAPALGELMNLKELDLSNNTLGEKSFQALQMALKNLKNLRMLSILANPSQNSVNALAKMLIEIDSLTAIELSSCNFEAIDSPTVVKSLLQNKNLENFIFANNKLGDGGIKDIAPFLTGFKKLKNLNLSSNQIGPEGISFLISPLLSLKDSIQELYLGQNKIGDAGISTLIPALSQLLSLRLLSLGENNIGLNGLKILCPILSHLPKISNIMMYGNKLDGEAIDYLINQLLNSKLDYLDLSDCNLNKLDWKHIILFLNVYPYLKKIKLHRNSLTKDYLWDLLLSISAHPNLTYVSISISNDDKHLFKDFISAILRRKPNLTLFTQGYHHYMN